MWTRTFQQADAPRYLPIKVSSDVNVITLRLLFVDTKRMSGRWLLCWMELKRRLQEPVASHCGRVNAIITLQYARDLVCEPFTASKESSLSLSPTLDAIMTDAR